MMRHTLTALILGLIASNTVFASDNSETVALYKEHCAVCHGENRLGLMGPALLPENLKRLRKKKALKVIAEGRVATQMPAFKEKLNNEQIAAIADYVYTPLAKIPTWGMEDIRKSRIIHKPNDQLPKKPIHDAELMNMFVVVELADHHTTILDGNKMEPLKRLKTRFALHGGPKYSPDGRFVYYTSRDGWVSKLDMYSLEFVAEVRAGINTRNAAVSSDGKYLMVANYLPHTLSIIDTETMQPLKVIEVKNQKGESSRVSAVYTADPRESFIVALKDIPEVWEINYADPPPVGFGKWMHDYRRDSGEAPKELEMFPIRQIETKAYLDDFFFTQDYSMLIGASRDGSGEVVDLDLGRSTHDLDLPGMPHLNSGITWEYEGRPILATPHLKKNAISVIDMKSWKVIKEIETLGPGFFMRSHEKTPYAWVDVFFGKHKDAVHIIDKRSLEIVKTLRPEPGKVAAHVEFDMDGKHALLSIWDNDGAVIVYNADTLEEIKRLPMKKPSGKYNVHNKITRSAGTSH